jgi:F-type H+-transporting ATPase subunit alpha
LNVGISVSRVGSSAQTRAMKQVAAKMKLELAAFRELAAFAQFASDLDRATRAQLERGLRAQEVLKQPQFQPFSLAREVTIIYALTNGFVDDVPIENVRHWENEFHRFMETAHPEILETIMNDKAMSDETIGALRTAIDEYKKQVVV